MALLKPAQHLGLILSQVPHAGAHATEHEGQRQAGGAGRNHRQRGTTPAPHHQPHGEDRGHELDASRRDERRGRPAVLPVQVGLDPEQAEHQDDLVQLNEVHVAQEELRRENEGDDERPGRAIPPGMERVADQLREVDRDRDEEHVEEDEDRRRRREGQQGEQLEHHRSERRVGGAADMGREIEERAPRQEVVSLQPERSEIAVDHRLPRRSGRRDRPEQQQEQQEREREQHAPRRPVFAPQNPGHGLGASSDDRYARAAGKTRSWASASEPSNDAPAAFVCPPPPKRPASSATSTSPSDRKLTLTFPFARLRNSIASRTPAMERGYSTIPSRSSAVAWWRRSASGGTVTHARPWSGSTTRVSSTSVIRRTRPSGALAYTDA